MAGAIEALTTHCPLILVLEDLHWSDYSTLDLIAFLARRRDPARLTVIRNTAANTPYAPSLKSTSGSRKAIRRRI